MRWIVVGSAGMLGQDLLRVLATHGQDVRGYDLPDINILDPQSLAACLVDVDVVVNCAAYTAVDAAEEAEDKAFALNAVGPQLLAAACSVAGARLVQISTDYVFNGAGTVPYGENDLLEPLGAYGRTKAAGEWAVQANCADYLIVRTAWLYGRAGNSFPRTMARLGRERDALQVVNDQVGQPTWTVDLSELIFALAQAGVPSGIYHGTSAGQASWFDFAQAVLAADSQDPNKISPTDSAHFVRPAPRPAYSVLAHAGLARVGVAEIGPWEERWKIAASEILAEV